VARLELVCTCDCLQQRVEEKAAQTRSKAQSYG
jgi:hypothetical protein